MERQSLRGPLGGEEGATHVNRSQHWEREGGWGQEGLGFGARGGVIQLTLTQRVSHESVAPSSLKASTLAGRCRHFD
jgi:hypothetical protein